MEQSADVVIRVWPPPTQTVTLAYNTGDGDPDVRITMVVPSGITGQTVLEIAASQDKRFQFNATYFTSVGGYSLQEIGGKAAVDGAYWKFLVGTEKFQPYSASPVGYSGWYPFDGSIMKWEYTK